MTPLHNSRWCYSCCSLYEWDSWNCIVLGCLMVLSIRLSTLQMKRQRKVKYLAQVYPLCKWQSQDLHLGYLASSRVWTHNYCTLLKNLNFWFKKKSLVSYGHLRWLFLGHCFSRSGPWTRNISIIWELVRNVNYTPHPHPRYIESEILGWDPAICALTSLQLILMHAQIWELLF